jgi:hypothetical protein
MLYSRQGSPTIFCMAAGIGDDAVPGVFPASPLPPSGEAATAMPDNAQNTKVTKLCLIFITVPSLRLDDTLEKSPESCCTA